MGISIMKENLLIDKSIVFASRIIKLHQYLIRTKKEAAETEYWLKLLISSDYITADMGKSLLADCLEIKRMLIASINTAKGNFAATNHMEK